MPGTLEVAQHAVVVAGEAGPLRVRRRRGAPATARGGACRPRWRGGRPRRPPPPAAARTSAGAVDAGTTPVGPSRCSSAKPTRGTRASHGRKTSGYGGGAGQRRERRVRRRAAVRPRRARAAYTAASVLSASIRRSQREEPVAQRAAARGRGRPALGAAGPAAARRRRVGCPCGRSAMPPGDQSAARRAARGCGRRGAAGRTRRRAGPAMPRCVGHHGDAVDVPARGVSCQPSQSWPGSQAGTTPQRGCPGRAPARDPATRCSRPPSVSAAWTTLTGSAHRSKARSTSATVRARSRAGSAAKPRSPVTRGG